MDWSPKNNYNKTNYEALDTPYLAKSHTSWAVLVNTWAGSHFQAVERDLLVTYLVMDICGFTHKQYIKVSQLEMAIFKDHSNHKWGEY